jgi:nitrogenase-stabilizing/protective protein
MNGNEFDRDLAELSSAEEFLDYFGIAYDPSVVDVARLHILQRFHDYIDGVKVMPQDGGRRCELYAGLLRSAYKDFVESDALTEKVFKVFHRHEPVKVTNLLMDLKRRIQSHAPKV